MTTAIAKKNEPAIEYCYGRLVEGHRTPDIIDGLRKAFPKCRANDIIATAVERLAIASQCDREVLVGWIFEGYREIYRRTMADADYSNAIKSLKELSLLEAKNRPDPFDDDDTEQEPE